MLGHLINWQIIITIIVIYWPFNQTLVIRTIK